VKTLPSGDFLSQGSDLWVNLFPERWKRPQSAVQGEDMAQGEGKEPTGGMPGRSPESMESTAGMFSGSNTGSPKRVRQSRFIRYSAGRDVSHLTDVDRKKLTSTIQISVVPELKQRIGDSAKPHKEEAEFVEIDLDGLVSILLDREPASFGHFLNELEPLKDVPSHVCDQLVRSVITRVGEMWTQDTTGFYEVTLAAARLQTFLRERLQNTVPGRMSGAGTRKILLAKVSGSEHTLGLMVVTACFQEAGWEVTGGAELECGPGMYNRLSRDRYGILGLSVSVSVEPAELAQIIEKARAASKNPRLGVCLGGPAIMTDGARFAGMDVDFVATDALTAVRSAEACIN